MTQNYIIEYLNANNKIERTSMEIDDGQKVSDLKHELAEKLN